MKKYSSCMLMSLLMITTAVAGCLEGDSEGGSIVGEWYAGESMVGTFNSNGTVGDSHGNIEANWSTDGNVLTIDEGQMTDGALEPSEVMYFHVSDGWLFIAEDFGGDCTAFSSNVIGNITVFLAAAENLTLPSICGSLDDYGFSNNQNDGPALYQYMSGDHPDAITNGTNDSLMFLYWAQAPHDLNWATISIQLIGDSGMPTTCTIQGGDDPCTIVEYGADATSWEVNETIHLKENNADLCAVAPCSFTIKISDTSSGNDLTGSSNVVVE